MYARLNPAYGWFWIGEDGTRSLFILSGVRRNAGMVSGITPDGRYCTRPLMEYDALSLDGETWRPFSELRPSIPWEEGYDVFRDVPLPDWNGDLE